MVIGFIDISDGNNNNDKEHAFICREDVRNLRLLLRSWYSENLPIRTFLGLMVRRPNGQIARGPDG